jgi:hypothetical protein
MTEEEYRHTTALLRTAAGRVLFNEWLEYRAVKRDAAEDRRLDREFRKGRERGRADVFLFLWGVMDALVEPLYVAAYDVVENRLTKAFPKARARALSGPDLPAGPQAPAEEPEPEPNTPDEPDEPGTQLDLEGGVPTITTGASYPFD